MANHYNSLVFLVSDWRSFGQSKDYFCSQKKIVQFNMARENAKLEKAARNSKNENKEGKKQKKASIQYGEK